MVFFDVEHIAFLRCWLQHSFLCTKSFAINNGYLPLARLLYEGIKISLSKFLLANLYESLGNAYDDLLAHGRIPNNLTGRLWLL